MTPPMVRTGLPPAEAPGAFWIGLAGPEQLPAGRVVLGKFRSVRRMVTADGLPMVQYTPEEMVTTIVSSPSMRLSV